MLKLYLKIKNASHEKCTLMFSITLVNMKNHKKQKLFVNVYIFVVGVSVRSCLLDVSKHCKTSWKNALCANTWTKLQFQSMLEEKVIFQGISAKEMRAGLIVLSHLFTKLLGYFFYDLWHLLLSYTSCLYYFKIEFEDWRTAFFE